MGSTPCSLSSSDNGFAGRIGAGHEDEATLTVCDERLHAHEREEEETKCGMRPHRAR